MAVSFVEAPSPMIAEEARSGRLEPAARQLSGEVERARRGRDAVRARPEDLELEPVRILGVERKPHAVTRRAHQRARLHQPPLRGDEIGERAYFPGGVIHPGHALVGRRDARLLEKAQVMVVGRARNLQERGVGTAMLDLEAEEIAVEADAPLDVRHPEHEVLEAREPNAGGGDRHGIPPFPSSTLTVMATQAMRVSAPGTRS